MKRAFLLPGAVFIAATVFAGCGAGTSTFSGGGPTPIVTPTSGTVSPTPTPVPSATPVPGTTPQSGNTAPIYHPADAGDVFSIAGTITTSYARPDATPDPEPTQTTLDSVTQTITVSNPGGTFNGNSANVDFHTVETDLETAPVDETYTSTTDDYYTFSDSIYTGNFSNLGYNETDDGGFTATYTFGTGNGLVDELPETAGASWTNNAAATIATTGTNNESSLQTIAADGSYVETNQYPNVNAMGPTTTQTIDSNLDGSGSINTPLFGTALTGNATFSVTAPSAAGSTGTITGTTSEPPVAPSTAAPTVTTTAIPNWIPTGFLGTALATETDTDNGSTNIPQATCPIPAALGTTANEIVQKKSSVDPMLGILETTTTTTYDIANVGPACITIADVQTVYYDFSGQNGFTFFSGTPQQITTMNESLYLTAETLQSVARKPALRRATSHALAAHAALVQGRIAELRAKQRQQRLHDFAYRLSGHAARAAQYRGIH